MTNPYHGQRLNMHARRLAAAALLIATALGCGGSDSTAAEQKSNAAPPAQASPLVPVLAKAHLAEAAVEARKWRSDAAIIQVGARRVPDDGKVAWWEYGAWSPSAKTCLVITFIRGKVNTQESGGEVCESDALGEIIDSDQAIKIARTNGVTKADVSMVAMASPTRKGQAVWSVIEEGMRNSGDITIDIDGASGKVLTTTRTP